MEPSVTLMGTNGMALMGTSNPLLSSDESSPSLNGHWNDWLIGESTAMRAVVEQVRMFAPSSAPVLITGESGTGKEVIARLVHYFSERATDDYVQVNCAALSESLIESELFGHEKGAFTGANQTRVGRLECAGSGTVLLDEISEIAPALQAKLLRVLEEEEFQRVGSNVSFPLRARIVATSNRCLADEVKSGDFREDLFYRLNVLQVDVPPLRERNVDVPLLVEHFVRVFRKEGKALVAGFSPDALELMKDYPWPGNVRQLRNTVRRLCIVAAKDHVTVDEVRTLGQLGSIGVPASASRELPSLYQMTLRDAQRLLVRSALERYDGNQTAAARHLGVSPRTLHNHLKRDPDLETRRAA